MLKKLVIMCVVTLMMAQVFQIGAVNAQTPINSSTHYYVDLSKSHWAAGEIMKLINMKAMEAQSDGKIRPNDEVTRAEAVAVVARATGVSLNSTFKMNAKDVPASHRYYNEIRKMMELGVLYNGDSFSPESPLQRDQMAKILSLAFNIEIDQQNRSSFSDMTKTHWAKDFVESMADTGIIKGVTTTKFGARSHVTRAQLAALTVRCIDFKTQLSNYTLAYDYLAKDYIVTTTNYKTWGNTTIAIINDIRVSKGLGKLKIDPALNQLAVVKAQDMIARGYFDHKSPFYGGPWDMATLFDYAYVSIGENLARNFKTPKETVDAWLASPSHRENLLGEHYTTTGIGVKATKSGDLYIVNLFVR